MSWLCRQLALLCLMSMQLLRALRPKQSSVNIYSMWFVRDCAATPRIPAGCSSDDCVMCNQYQVVVHLLCCSALSAVCAVTCRLDKSLTIGQMQGKFQLVLMPTAGHAIQVSYC